MEAHHNIAIDGPSGAGKSTLAKMLAQRLGYLYVDTGAIYRTVGLAAYRNGVDPTDPQGVEKLLNTLEITMGYGEDGAQRMYLNGEDVSREIRQHMISNYASSVAALPVVRAFLLEKQRSLAKEHDVIMDGRDIGTVVLPQAQMKIFLTADPKARAQRRYRELLERGQEAELEQILADVMERDRRDTEREISPLRQAEDAVVVDTTDKNLEQSLELLLDLVRRQRAK